MNTISKEHLVALAKAIDAAGQPSKIAFDKSAVLYKAEIVALTEAITAFVPKNRLDALLEPLLKGMKRADTVRVERENLAETVKTLAVVGSTFGNALAAQNAEAKDLVKAVGEANAIRKDSVDHYTQLARDAVAEATGIRKRCEEMVKGFSVPAPLRTVPRDDSGQRRASDNSVAVLEEALTATTHPETMVFLRQQIALAKAAR